MKTITFGRGRGNSIIHFWDGKSFYLEGVGEVNMISFEGVGEMVIKNCSGGRRNENKLIG